ncbi:MAG: hypothetical protein ACI4YA_00285 [Candidatus Spyradenecus sp.]
MKLNSSNHNPSVAARALSTVDCPLSTGARSALAPTEQEVALLTTQYRKAVNGLYEAYRFGQMLAQVKARLEQFSGDAACGTARETTVGNNGNALAAPGWNAGTGLRGWLAEHCPEINYSTARRFLAIAEKTNLALAAQGELAHGEEEAASRYPLTAKSEHSEELCQHSSACEPSEQAVRDFLEGKSQRAVLRLGGKREGAGRKPKDWAAALGTSPEVAMKRLEEALAPLNELIVVKQAHLLLSPGDLDTIRAALDLLHERVWEEAARRGTQD